ncbi:MAG: SUMF1/EgtB/PvdO family nonheme iron enzyme, partial [Planctomycetes bacterium]|nr:SUMF1/EgtB/PvdO family nonheme iron enzyme [Planctomycetota bacterium]
VGTVAELRAKLREDFDAVVFVGHSDAVFEGPVEQHRPATGLCFLIDGKRELLSFADLRADLRRPRLLVLHSCWTDPGALRELALAADHVVAWGAEIDARSCRIATQQLFTALAASPPAALGDALRIARRTLFCGLAHASGRAWLLTHYARDRHAGAFVDRDQHALAAFRGFWRKELLRLPEALEGYVDGAQVLRELYVELDVAPGRSTEEIEAQRLMLGSGPKPLMQWLEAHEPHRSVLLCGEPGAGKSTLLRYLAVQLLDREWIAVYCTMQSVLESGLRDPVELAVAIGALERSHVERARARGRFALLLDGLDEASDRASAERAITALRARDAGGTIVVAARSDGLRRFDDEFVVARVCELDERGQAELVRRWFQALHAKPLERQRWTWLAAQGRGPDDQVEAATRAFLAELTPRSPLAIVCRNPLALTLCVLRVASEGPANLPTTRWATLDWLCRFLLANEHRATRLFEETDTPRRILGQLSLQMLEAGIAQCELAGPDLEWTAFGREFTKLVPEPLLRKADAQHARAFVIRRRAPSEGRNFAERLRAAGLIEPVDAQTERRLRFPIQSLADFLAADALRGRFESDLPALLSWLKDRREAVLANLGRWSETLALCASWQGKRAKDWLLGLAEIDPKLGLRALGRADHPPLEAIVALLGRGEPHEKLEFWDGFAASFGIDSREDAERALELIEQAAPSLRSGTDRCLMEEEAITAAERFGVPPAAVQRVQRIVRASPSGQPLDVELFAKQPVSGEPLWKRIPYEVGGEDRSFWMMAVPVTVDMFGAYTHTLKVPWRTGQLAIGDAAPLVEIRPERRGRDFNRILTRAHPMLLNWFEATAFARWLDGALTDRLSKVLRSSIPRGWHIRLPAECEWRLACCERYGGNYSCGDTLTREVAWFGEAQDGARHAVGMLLPNDFGLRDMHGNVWEWCIDMFDKPDKLTMGRAARRVMKGGSYRSSSDMCRIAVCAGESPVSQGDNAWSGGVGVRLVLGRRLGPGERW